MLSREDKLEYIRYNLPILEHESTVNKSLAGGVVICDGTDGEECDLYVRQARVKGAESVTRVSIIIWG